MAQSNSKATSSTLKYWFVVVGLLLPILTWGTINTFDKLRGNQLNIGNVQVSGNTVSTTNTNGDLNLDMNGTGSVILTDLTATTVPYLDASKKITSSSVTPTELAFVHNVTAQLCGISQSCTLTQKTITGNTAVNLVSGSGTLVLNTTGTVTLPNATDTLMGKATTDVMTNKSYAADGTGNSITNIADSSIKSGAAIAVNKLAALTVSRALVSDGSGFVSAATTTATEIGYVNGVTSSIQTQINALSTGTLPTGAVFMFVGSGCPGSTLSLDGSSLLRAGTYAALFAVVGTTYGSADGTHFTLPDTRGVFVRGSGSQTISSITYTGTRGTSQGDQFQTHKHLTGTNTPANSGTWDSVNTWTTSTANPVITGSSTANTYPSLTTAPPATGPEAATRTGAETRPANITLLFCVQP